MDRDEFINQRWPTGTQFDDTCNNFHSTVKKKKLKNSGVYGLFNFFFHLSFFYQTSNGCEQKMTFPGVKLSKENRNQYVAIVYVFKDFKRKEGQKFGRCGRPRR